MNRKSGWVSGLPLWLRRAVWMVVVSAVLPLCFVAQVFLNLIDAVADACREAKDIVVEFWPRD